MTNPAPKRKTKERILDSALAMFNRFGEPNVSINAVAKSMGISPGNLYYHFPSKDSVTQALIERHQLALGPLLSSAHQAGDVETAWFFMHTLFEHIWHGRFIYRDQNNLLTKSLWLENALHDLLEQKIKAFQALIESLASNQWLTLAPDQRPMLAHSLTLVINYWMSFAYVRQPREALEPASQKTAVLEGVQHALALLSAHLTPTGRAHWQAILATYPST